jgi:hypothetical protein
MGAAQLQPAPPQRLEIDGAILRVLVKVMGLEGGALSESAAAEVADFLKVQALEISKEALGAGDKVDSPFVHAGRTEVAVDQKVLQQLLCEIFEEAPGNVGQMMLRPMLDMISKRCMNSCDEAENLLLLIAVARQAGKREGEWADIESGLAPFMQMIREEELDSFPMPDMSSLLVWMLTHCLLIKVSHMLSKGRKLELHDFQLALFISYDEVPALFKTNATTKAKPQDDETGCLDVSSWKAPAAWIICLSNV